jgi:hypothetical protein
MSCAKKQRAIKKREEITRRVEKSGETERDWECNDCDARDDCVVVKRVDARMAGDGVGDEEFFFFGEQFLSSENKVEVVGEVEVEVEVGQSPC